MSRNDPSFLERQKASQAAKLALIAKAKEKSVNSAEFAERQKERIAIAEARDERRAKRDEEKAAVAAELAAKKAEIEAEKKRLAEAEMLAKEAEERKKIEDALALKAQQKANRDAKYAARQARRDERRKGLPAKAEEETEDKKKKKKKKK
ncbi:MAG: hypothetical protein IT566_04115 [Rhodospirillaceae bacterium]|nr:hypothetical protein [Rhodospirillaceae bacterium]